MAAKVLAKPDGSPLDDPSEFRSQAEPWIYRFPLTPMHPKLGRLSVELELFFERKWLKRMLIGFRQTEDPRYQGKVFDFGCRSGMLSTFNHKPGQSFFLPVWEIHQCPNHGGVMLVSTVPDDTQFLCVSILSTMATVWYEKEDHVNQRLESGSNGLDLRSLG